MGVVGTMTGMRRKGKGLVSFDFMFSHVVGVSLVIPGLVDLLPVERYKSFGKGSRVRFTRCTWCTNFNRVWPPRPSAIQETIRLEATTGMLILPPWMIYSSVLVGSYEWKALGNKWSSHMTICTYIILHNHTYNYIYICNIVYVYNRLYIYLLYTDIFVCVYCILYMCRLKPSAFDGIWPNVLPSSLQLP